MIVRDGGFPTLNAFGIEACDIKCDPENYGNVSVSLNVRIMDHVAGITYGTWKIGANALSRRTFEKLGDFLRSAELDFADGLKGDGWEKSGWEKPADINNLKVE